MKRFDARVWYRLEMTAVSPLAVGSGNNANTDMDVIVDHAGRPFIPGTAIAGVLRSFIADGDPAAAEALFGTIENGIGGASRVMVYDAVLQDADAKKYFITARDCVKLENKVAVPGAKFDLEAVEPGVTFTAALELLDGSRQALLERALAAVDAGFIRFGHKTTRGYGQVKLKVFKKCIPDLETYLREDLFGDGMTVTKNAFMLPPLENAGRTLSLKLRLKGCLSVRSYSTEPDRPDFETLGLATVRDENGAKVPVIPGTTWSGAFRDRFTAIAGEEAADRLFGFVREKTGETARSRITFAESQLNGGRYAELTRNAINRFTGGTMEKALYTERPYYGGETELVISVTDTLSDGERFALAACVEDLNNGFLPVGGLSSVGHGLFEVTAINGAACADGPIRDKIMEALR